MFDAKVDGYAGALKQADECVTLHPSFAAAHAKRGSVRSYRQEWEQAAADYAKAIELDAKQPAYFDGRGYALSRMKKYDAAMAEFDKALALDPDDVDAHVGRGDLYRFQWKGDPALAEYGKAISSAEKQGLGIIISSEAYFGRGNVHLGAGNYKQAIDDFTMIIDNLGAVDDARESRALAYELAGQTDSALADYEAILVNDAQNKQALESAGKLRLRKGDREKAKAHFEALLAIDPNNETAKKELATLAPKGAADFVKLGQQQAIDNKFDDAIRSYGDAIRLDPNNAEAYTGRASAHGSKGAPDLAIADYTKAIQLDPNGIGAYNGRGAMYAEKGDQAHALADYSETIKRASAEQKFEVILGYTGRADIYVKQGKPELAMPDFEKAIAIASTDSMANYILGPDALLGRARLNVAAGKNDLAIVDLQAALKLNPKHEVVKAELAKLQPAPTPTPQTAEEWLKQALQQGRDKNAAGALASLSKCIELKPLLPCYVLRGNVETMMNRYDEARADYDKAIALDPKHAAPYTGRGIMFAKQGKKDEAVRDLRQALSINPNIGDAKRALERLGVQP